MMRRPDPGDHRVDEGSEYPRKNDENSSIESAKDETCAVDVETDSFS